MAKALLKAVRIGIPILILWGVLGVYVPVFFEEVRYQARLTAYNFQAVFPQGVRGLVIPSWSISMQPEWAEDYGLEIPKLGLREPVVEGVDAGNKGVYLKALQNGIAHAAGTVLPGEKGVGYYFAHSSGLPFWGGRTATFATLYKLEPGDDIYIYRHGKQYNYTVVEKTVVSPDDVRLLTAEADAERIVLQTCWPLGTNINRMLVVGQRKDS